MNFVPFFQVEMMTRLYRKAETIDESTLGLMRDLWAVITDPKAKKKIAQYSIAIAIVIAANAVAQIRFNSWQGDIYDAFAKQDLNAFWWQVGVFMLVVGALLCLGVAQTWIHELLKVRLRQAITFSLLDEWLKPRRAAQLPLSGEISANPDQRIQDDTKRLSELSVDLAVGLFQSSMLLIAFIGVLWQLSSQVVFTIGGRPLVIPGYMVWAALAYAAIGSLLTWRIGRPLIEAHAEARAKEAEFRLGLVRVSEHAEAIALHQGEGRERSQMNAPVKAVLVAFRLIARRLALLTWVTGGYGWFAILAPLVLAAPGYFGGSLTLGGLMMVVGGFFQVQQALRWYVDKFPMIAEWRAVLTRVIGYRSALIHLDQLGADVGHISYEQSTGDSFVLDDVCVYAPHGRVALDTPSVTIIPGERVLIEATPKSGKSTFTKAMAGAWVWGRGTIRLPPKKDIMFLPQAPYVPFGTLRSVLAYPKPSGYFSDKDINRALERVKLDRYHSMLDNADRWDKALSLDEQRRVDFARLLVHKPKWVIQDESMSELDEDNRILGISIFENELKASALISIGRFNPSHDFYEKRFVLQTRLPVPLRLPLKFEGTVVYTPRDVADMYARRKAAAGGKS